MTGKILVVDDDRDIRETIVVSADVQGRAHAAAMGAAACLAKPMRLLELFSTVAQVIGKKG